VFLTLGMMQFGIALGVRAQPGTWTNPFLLIAVAIAFALQLAGLYVPALRDLLETQPLTATEVAAITALSAVGYLAARRVRSTTATPLDARR
jgi:P-type Ca2+ transporter type 2C